LIVLRRRTILWLLLATCFHAVSAQTGESAKVIRVVDGDTLQVDIAGQIEKVRLIGVDTPETVHPRKPVEFFGIEASIVVRRHGQNA